jgi:DNA-binding NtrC family response regulator
VLAALEMHDWPGNVRALRHATERAVILADGESFRTEDFSVAQQQPQSPSPAPSTPMADASDLNLDRAERQMIEAALRKHSYNISLASGELGLSRAALYRRMEKYGL